MRAGWAVGAALAAAILGWGSCAAAAEPQYPFIGSWVRSDRVCSPSGVRERIYTTREVISPRGRCVVRRIAHGSGGYEIFERCERPNERPYNISEIIRMTGPNAMVLTRQVARLKLSRSLRFSRCQAPMQSPPQPKPQGGAPAKPH